ncbi:MAG TPA: 50S ribosomal protein L13 [Euryarchaeota archaeon]|nr:50S ribosomal protein L13 [Euryarchaeota archaeon]
MIVVDGSDAPMGRLASYVARQLLKGETVYVVNAEKMVISGDPDAVYERYKSRIDLKTHRNPIVNSPKYPRTVTGIFRRSVRGMLPRWRKRGRDALRRLRVWRGVPDEVKNVELVRPDFKLPRTYIRLGDLAKRLGGW